jgi:hypothetical protein
MNATISDPHVSPTEYLNVLLRSEMAAVETYTQALGRFDDPVLIGELQKIRDEHSRAVRQLRDHVIRSGGHPVESQTLWAAFASTEDAASSGMCPTTALAALRQGEEQNISEFEAALGSAEIDGECQLLLRTNLLPAGHNHVEQLNRLLGGMKR